MGRGAEGENMEEAAGAGVVRFGGFRLHRCRSCLLSDKPDEAGQNRLSYVV